MQDIDKKSLYKFGKGIKKLRRQYKWSLSKLSHRAGIAPSTLKRIESGDSEPKYLTIEKIAYSLNISLVKLFELIEEL